MADGRSDGELVEAARGGDAEAFSALLSRHYDAIFRVAWKWCGDRTEAEDVAQEVAVRLGEAIRGFEGRARFSTWITSITVNAARDALRRRARLAAREAAYARLSPEATEAADDRPEALWQAVRRLPEKERDAVLLVHAEGMSHADAAAVLGVREVTVSWRIHQAKRRLKAELKVAAHA